MKRLILMTLLLCCIMILPASAFAHKLIPTDGSNNDIVSALEIPDPIVSWAMYEELSNNVLYYKFDAKKGDKLSASIVIPKLDGLEDFSPSLAFIAPSFTIDLITELKVLDSTKSFPFPIPDGYDAIVFDYNGKLPSKESYEPFGQITYWERQEIDLVVPVDGTYYLAVYDSSGDYGKLALAIGYVEDFSAIDFMTVLPYAWFESRYFVEDYVTPVIASLVAIGLILGVVFLIYKRIRHKSKSWH